MFHHRFVLDLNVKDILKVFAISGRIECIFYFSFIDFDLFLDILKMILPIFKVKLLYFVLFQQVLILIFLSLNSLAYLPLFFPYCSQPQIYLNKRLPSLRTLVRF